MDNKIEVKVPNLYELLNGLFKESVEQFKESTIQRKFFESIGYPEDIIKCQKARERFWKRQFMEFSFLVKKYCTAHKKELQIKKGGDTISNDINSRDS